MSASQARSVSELSGLAYKKSCADQDDGGQDKDDGCDENDLD
jgi:hypothetical protein